MSAEKDPMRVLLCKCGECEQVSSDHAWAAAWWQERSRRIAQLHRDHLPADEYGTNYGMGDTMVCPRCGFVHRDDDSGAGVEELLGVATVALEPKRGAS